MIIFFLFIFLITSLQCMESTHTSAYLEKTATFQVDLKKYADSIATIRSSFWQIQGLLVRYQNSKHTISAEIQTALNCHDDNIRKMFDQVRIECDNANSALISGNLNDLIRHTKNAQYFFYHLTHEATHFHKMIANRLSRSNM